MTFVIDLNLVIEKRIIPALPQDQWAVRDRTLARKPRMYIFCCVGNPYEWLGD